MCQEILASRIQQDWTRDTLWCLGGADELKREELLSRGARLHEGMRLIKGQGWKIKTNVEILFFECLKMVA